MNITPHVSPLPVQTAVNPPTDNLRRENSLREVIAPVSAAAQSAAEKAVASDRERGKSPTQNSEQIDFASLQEQAEKEASTITDGSSQDKPEQGAQNSQQDVDTEDIDNDGQISAEEKVQAQEIKNLKDRDHEVRTHELAHATVGGAFTSSPTFSYEIGPDGKRYAVGGEVDVDLSSVPGDPRATISKMQKVHAAALAPANPSIQDTRVAAAAARIILQAQSELSSPDEYPERNSTVYPKENDVFSRSDSEDYDDVMNRTLSAQEYISPTRDLEIDKRAERIEDFYLNINQAYEKAPSSNFTISV